MKAASFVKSRRTERPTMIKRSKPVGLRSTFEKSTEAALLDASRTFEREFGDDLIGIILTGSALVSTPSEFGDIDLCILTKRPFFQRQRRTFLGGEFDVFVDPPARVARIIAERQNRPVIWMYAHCRVVYDVDDVARRLHESAKTAWALGRAEATPGIRFRYRSEIVDHLGNILESTDPVIVRYLIGLLLPLLVDAFWFEKRLWGHHRKHAMDAVAREDHFLFSLLVRLMSGVGELTEKKTLAKDAVEHVLGSEPRAKLFDNYCGPVMRA